MLLHGKKLQLGDWKVNGFSCAGRATWLVFPSLDLVCDIGWCVESARRQSRLFLSHFHDDHSGGLLAWVHWRQRPASNPPPTIFTHNGYLEPLREMLEASARLQQCVLRYTLVGLEDGDRVALDAKHTLEAFETDHHLPTLGCMIVEKRSRLKPEWRGVAHPAIREALQAGTEIKEQVEAIAVAYTSDTTPAVFTRKPQLLRAEVLITECTYLDGVLEFKPDDTSTDGERSGVTHTHIRGLAKQMALFQGDVLAVCHIAPRYEGCDVRAYMLPRLPAEQRSKLVVLPHGVSSTPLGAVPSDKPEWFALETSKPLLASDWQLVPEKPGPWGWKKAKRQAELAQRWPGFRVAWQWGEHYLSESEALQRYEDAYFAFLERNPELVAWLVKTAADVYDTDPSNIEAGLDYGAQHSGRANHFQDIAVRRVLMRLGQWFQGDHWVEIRGERSEGYVLNPGVVPFHRPEMIGQPEWPSKWFWPGSVESFWQSNKVLLVPRL